MVIWVVSSSRNNSISEGLVSRELGLFPIAVRGQGGKENIFRSVYVCCCWELRRKHKVKKGSV